MSDFSDRLDEIMVAMLVIPHTGGEIYKHSPEKFRQAKEQIIRLIMDEVIGEERGTVYAPEDWFKGRTDLRAEQRKILTGGKESV